MERLLSSHPRDPSGEEPMENIIKTNQLCSCIIFADVVEWRFHLTDDVHTLSENDREVWQPTSNFMSSGRWLVVDLADGIFSEV